MKRSCKEFNGRICALFLMQYTILIPLMGYISPMVLVSAFGILLILSLFVKNGLVIDTSILLFYFAFMLFFLIKIAISESSFSVILRLIVYTAPSALIMVYGFDYKEFIHFCTKLSRLSFLLIFWSPFTSSYAYMRFGYGMVPVVIFCYLDLMYYRPQKGRWSRLADIAIVVIGTTEILIYGARGAFFTTVLFFCLERFVVNKLFTTGNVALTIGAVALYFEIVPLLELLERLSIQIGIYSYSIAKFRMQIQRGIIAASSGRDKLYAQAFEKMRKHPFIGNEIMLDESGGDYAHNLFLQVGEDLGVIALAVVVAFVIWVLYRMSRKKSAFEEKIILCVLFSVSIGRLMFSSTLWRRPEFWMLVFFSITMRNNRQYSESEADRQSASVIPALKRQEV